MGLSVVDYLLVIAYFCFVIWVGLAFKKKGGTGMRAYFLSGGKLPWWLLGTSMVATTFAAGTPIWVAGMAYTHGLSKQWVYWSLIFGSMLTTFFFAKLWKRTDAITDAEYITLRYSGKEARFLRGFRALYMGFIMNALVLGTGLISICMIGGQLLGLEGEAHRWTIAIVCGGVALFYSSLSGLTGIVITDFVQFFIAIIGTGLIAIFACAQPEVGGLSGLVEKLGQSHPGHLDIFPSAASAGTMTLKAVIILICVRWWSQIYGGSEPGGASHVAQRMLAARSERDSFLGTMWFNIANFVFKPLPWIITGLAAVILFPGMKGEQAYIKTIGFLPAGVKGIVLAAFFAAFMSTIDTRLNLGAAYFVNDFYKPFISKDRSEKHYIMVSRIITVVQMICGYAILLFVRNIISIMQIYFAIASGSGLIYILRWYWWRVSAWSEIAAMGFSFVLFLVFRLLIFPSETLFNQNDITVLVVSTISVSALWILVTFLTKPSSEEKLKEFYRKVRPAGPFWKPIAEKLKDEKIQPGYDMRSCIIGWVWGNMMVFSMVFGILKYMFLEWRWGVVCTVLFIISAVGTIKSIRKINLGRKTDNEMAGVYTAKETPVD